MAHYYLDCEFKSYKGKLISMALVRGDGASIYMLIQGEAVMFPENGNKDTKLSFLTENDSWVAENVLPIIYDCPVTPAVVRPIDAARMIEAFMAYDSSPHVVADWPDDLKYFNELIIVGPGEAINVPHMTQEWIRCEPYPTFMEGPVKQHNAWWDAMALRFLITQQRSLQKA